MAWRPIRTLAYLVRYFRRNIAAETTPVRGFFLTIAFALFMVVLLPFLPFMMRSYAKRPFVRIQADFDRRWRESAAGAADWLSDLYKRAEAAGPVGSVDVEPYGRIKMPDRVEIFLLLYEAEWTLGRYERAMGLVDSTFGTAPRLPDPYLRKARCLVALGRREQALATLQLGLQHDRGKAIQRMINELRGSGSN